MSSSSIWSIDRTIGCNHSGSGQSWERFSKVPALLFCVISKTLFWGGSYSSAEMQSVYTTAPADWAVDSWNSGICPSPNQDIVRHKAFFYGRSRARAEASIKIPWPRRYYPKKGHLRCQTINLNLPKQVKARWTAPWGKVSCQSQPFDMNDRLPQLAC